MKTGLLLSAATLALSTSVASADCPQGLNCIVGHPSSPFSGSNCFHVDVGGMTVALDYLSSLPPSKLAVDAAMLMQALSDPFSKVQIQYSGLTEHICDGKKQPQILAVSPNN